MAEIRIVDTEYAYACAEGDTLLRAALRAGLGLRYECNTGSCGSCKVGLIEGDVKDLYPGAPGIGMRDRERGRCLACQSVPLGDCVLRARVEGDFVPVHRPKRMPARLETVRDITRDIREFGFRAEGQAAFLAGQFAMVAFDDGPSRAYSMSNTSNPEGRWNFMVRRTPDGRMSRALFEMEVGGAIEIDAPYGHAYLREDVSRDIVCIAGGSGIAPMASIIDAAAQAGGPATWFFYGGRGPDDVPRVADLLGIVEPRQQLQWHPVISVPALAEGTDWTGEVGFVHELLPKKLPRPLPEYEYYVAGPPPMVRATLQLLAKLGGVPPSQVHADCFY